MICQKMTDAYYNAKREHPNKAHCSCVLPLKIRIAELETELAKIKSDPSIVMAGNTKLLGGKDGHKRD